MRSLMAGPRWKRGERIGYIALGIFSTMPIVGIPVLGRDISVYTILFALCLALLLVKTVLARRVRVGKHSKWLALWLCAGLIGCGCGWLFLKNSEPAFSEAAASGIPKVLLFLAFLILFRSGEEGDEACLAIAKGFLIGCALNCAWAVIDALCFYVFGFSLNNQVFAGYIVRNNIRLKQISLNINGMLRSGGFNYDPAHLGILAPILAGYAMKRHKPWLFLLAIGGVLASASTTGLVTMAVVVLFTVDWKAPKKYFNVYTLIAALAIFDIVGLLAIVRADLVYNIMDRTFLRFFDRISTVYLQPGYHDIRVDYLLLLPRAMGNVLPFLGFGSGFGTASLGYTRSESILKVLELKAPFPYDMENTYIAYLLDTGIIGFALFITTLVMLWKGFICGHRKREADGFTAVMVPFILASLVTMLFYHYILFAPQLLLFTAGLAWLDKDKPAEIEKVDGPEVAA